MAIQDMARDFAMNKVLPVANELDPEHGMIPDELRKEMGELGFFGIMVPERTTTGSASGCSSTP